MGMERSPGSETRQSETLSVGGQPAEARAAASETITATRFGRWVHVHSLAVDVVIATLVFLYDLMYTTSLFIGTESLSLSAFVAIVLLSSAICVLYVLRRRSPLLVSAVIYLAAWAYALLASGLGVAPLVALALMLYYLGTRFDWKILTPATLAVVVWMVVASVPLVEAENLRIGEVGMLILAGLLAAVVGAVARLRRLHVAGLQEAAWRLARERDAQAQVAAAEERARIAREIHDIVAHGLGTMVVVADGATVTADAEPQRAKAMMAQVRDTGRTAMSDMRRMLDVLRDDAAPSMAPQPSLAQLDRLVEPLRATGLRVDVSVSGEPQELPSGVDLAAYRVVQESLTNARKHGGPMLSVVKVSIVYTGAAVEVGVVDDGQGPVGDPGSGTSGGHGLVGMRERVAAYDGELTLRPRARGGFEVHAVLPTGGDE